MTTKFEPSQVRDGLIYLRKGMGLTPRRMAQALAVRAVLGGESTPYELLEERLVSAIRSLQDQDAQVLLDVFRLSPETADIEELQLRRDHFGEKNGIQRAAVADRDAKAIERLLIQLITGWYPKSPSGIRTAESHNGLVQHAAKVTTVVRDGRLLESEHHYKFFAVFDDLAYVTITTGATEPVVPGPGFRLETEQIEGGYRHRFWHKEPMRRGQTYDLRFRLIGDPQDPARLVEESLAFHEPTRFAVFEAVFLGATPLRIWKYSGLTMQERPGIPRRDQLLDPDGRATVVAEFHDLHGGLFAGLAWLWPDEVD